MSDVPMGALLVGAAAPSVAGIRDIHQQCHRTACVHTSPLLCCAWDICIVLCNPTAPSSLSTTSGLGRNSQQLWCFLLLLSSSIKKKLFLIIIYFVFTFTVL